MVGLVATTKPTNRSKKTDFCFCAVSLPNRPLIASVRAIHSTTCSNPTINQHSIDCRSVLHRPTPLRPPSLRTEQAFSRSVMAPSEFSNSSAIVAIRMGIRPIDGGTVRRLHFVRHRCDPNRRRPIDDGTASRRLHFVAIVAIPTDLRPIDDGTVRRLHFVCHRRDPNKLSGDRRRHPTALSGPAFRRSFHEPGPTAGNVSARSAHTI